MDSLRELMDVAEVADVYPIHVLSYNRAGSAPLLNMTAEFDEDLAALVTVHVREEQKQAYRKAYPHLKVVSHRGPYGPWRVRDFIHRYARRRGQERIVVLDDDITKISVMEDRSAQPGNSISGRVLLKSTPYTPVEYFTRSLAVLCLLADHILDEHPDVWYLGARHGFMSSQIDMTTVATLNQGKFPNQVFLIDTDRFRVDSLPEQFQQHGDDLAIALEVLANGGRMGIITGITFDEAAGMQTTIASQAGAEINRDSWWADLPVAYPTIHRYVKITKRNPSGSVKGLAINWKLWNQETGEEREDLPMAEALAAYE